MKLAQVFTEDRYPYQSAVSVGGGVSLVIRYRPAPADAEANVRDFLKARLSELGLDGDAALSIVQGFRVDDDALIAFGQDYESLGADAGARVGEAARLSAGFHLSLLIGSWSVRDAGGREHGLDDAPDAEGCAALPADVQRAIHKLASEATPPAQALLFLGTSPRS